MDWKMKKLSAGLSVELTISIALVTVALFVTLGLFSDNLKEMITSGNLQKFFLGGDKTKYSAFNRDYSNAGVETLMTGEQGLEQIRKLANNASDELINNNINAPDKLTAKDANAILYYSLIVKAIVGEPHMCIPMKKDSDEKCIVPEIGGYKYAIDLNGYTATAVESNSPSIILSPLRQLRLRNHATSLASLASTITLNGNGKSTLTTEEKYDFITNATTNAKPYVDPGVLIFIPGGGKFHSSDRPSTTIQDALKDLVNNVYNNARIAYSKCDEQSGRTNCDTAINDTDIDNISNWANSIVPDVINTTYANSQDLYSAFIDSLTITKYADSDCASWKDGLIKTICDDLAANIQILNLLDDDLANENTERACVMLKNGLSRIQNDYNVTGPTISCDDE